jgi:hypothetical protein
MIEQFNPKEKFAVTLFTQNIPIQRDGIVSGVISWIKSVYGVPSEYFKYFKFWTTGGDLNDPFGLRVHCLYVPPEE